MTVKLPRLDASVSHPHNELTDSLARQCARRSKQLVEMPQNTPCELCQRVGFVRLERVITGTTVTLSYYCGACDHSWQSAIPDPRKVPRVTLRPKEDRRRSRSN